MRVEVEHTSSDLSIRWWPYEKEDAPVYSSWSVHKRLDATSYEMPVPIEPAFIVPGTSLGQKTDAKNAREYVSILLQAATLAENLDRAIRDSSDFKHIEVIEAIPYPLKCPIRVTHRRGVTEITIPTQEG